MVCRRGRFLGPCFFIIDCMPISAIFAKHNVKYHLYADDTQLYAEFPCEVGDAIGRIERCTADVKRWTTRSLARTCQTAYFQLHKIAKVRQYLTTHKCKTIVHTIVTSRLNYGNAAMFRVNVCLIEKLQMVQHSAARLITRQRRRDYQHITPTLTALHWLPVR